MVDSTVVILATVTAIAALALFVLCACGRGRERFQNSAQKKKQTNDPPAPIVKHPNPCIQKTIDMGMINSNDEKWTVEKARMYASAVNHFSKHLKHLRSRKHILNRVEEQLSLYKQAAELKFTNITEGVNFYRWLSQHLSNEPVNRLKEMVIIANDILKNCGADDILENVKTPSGKPMMLPG